jgi:hypothetical protein
MAPLLQGFFARCFAAGAVMCPASGFCLRLDAICDRLPIIPAELSSDDKGGFFRSGRALSITPFHPGERDKL